MPKHVTESTGASITAEHQFTTGKLKIDATASFEADVVAERTLGTGVTVDGVLCKDGQISMSGAGTSLSIADGGTGASAAADALVRLGAASSGANSSITSLTGLTTPLSVAQGGTGAATFTANGLLYGNTTSAVQVSSAGTSSKKLVANTSGVPTWTDDIEYIAVIVVAQGTVPTATSFAARFHFPFAGYVQHAFAGVSTAGTGTTLNTIDFHVNTTSIFSTKLTIDSTETKSSTASVPAVIGTATSAFSRWDVGQIHVDNVASSTTGLVVTFTCVRTN